MKTFSFAPVVLLASVTISVLQVSCLDLIYDPELFKNCLNVGQQCSNNDECCSENCRISFQPGFAKYCREPLLISIKNLFNFDHEQGMCEFRIPKNVTNVYTVFREFGVSAAHSTLPTDTVVEVSVGQETILVTINDNRLNKSGILLELSPEAAAELSVTREGLVPCTIYVPIFENHPHLKDFVVYASCIGLIISYYLFNHYF